MADIKIRVGRHINGWNEDRLKSELATNTSLTTVQINDILKEVRKRLSALHQPIRPHDIASTAHYVIVEKGFRIEGEKYLKFINDRRASRRVEPTKLSFLICQYCGASNALENVKCSGC